MREQRTKDAIRVARYRRLHPRKIRAAKKRYYKNHRSQIREVQNEAALTTKRLVLTHYSPGGKLQCSWFNCDVVDIDMLSLDHINNDGAQERQKAGFGRNSGGSGQNQYRRVKRLGFPDGYQTLCWNHQWKKEIMRKRNIWESPQ